MNQITKLKTLQNLSYFDKNTLSQVIECSENSLYMNIKRWLRKGELLRLKRGLYVTRLFVASQEDNDAYREFIANKLYQPSYLSLEYVLQKHNLLTEAVYVYTSMTRKTKRVYQNAFGTFTYRNIKEELFCGYDLVEKGDFSIAEATVAKALFDYLYLKTLRIKSIDQQFFDSLRLNFDEFSKADFKEFCIYCRKTGAKKLLQLCDVIGNQP